MGFDAGGSHAGVFHRRWKELRNIGIGAPILRRRSQIPQIPWVIQRYANQPILARAIQRNAAGNPCRDRTAAGHILHPHLQAWREWSGKAYSAALRIHHQRVAVFGECARWIETAHAHRNLRPYPRTAPPLTSTVHTSSEQRIVCLFARNRAEFRAEIKPK